MDAGCPAQGRGSSQGKLPRGGDALDECSPCCLVLPTRLLEPWNCGLELCSGAGGGGRAPRTAGGSLVPKVSRLVGALWPLAL